MTELSYNINEHDYFAWDAASNSTLSRMKKSPAHCKAYLDMPVEPTAAMRIGSLIHKRVLEPSLFDDSYLLTPEGIDRRTKVGKAAWAEFQEILNGREPIKSNELLLANMISDSIDAHPAASHYLDGGRAEVSAFWQDPEFDFPCKCRFDFLSNTGYIVDLKTTQDASATEFAKSIYKFGYHRQAAMYMDGHTQCTGITPKGFVFIAVEKEPPYAVGVYVLDAESIALGREEYRELLAEFAKCKLENNWPAYSSEVQELSLPNWVFAQRENDVVEGIV